MSLLLSAALPPTPCLPSWSVCKLLQFPDALAVANQRSGILERPPSLQLRPRIDQTNARAS